MDREAWRDIVHAVTKSQRWLSAQTHYTHTQTHTHTHTESLGLESKHLFQYCGHCWVFQHCWHIECITFTASSFRIWNSSPGIQSPPLVLFVVMLHKSHLTSHSRMSGSRWVSTPLWLSGSLRSFLYSSSVFSWNLFLISSAFVRSLPFLSFILPFLHEMFPWYLQFSWRAF